MAWGIDQVELISLPFCRNGCRNDRDTTLAFLDHPVGYCSPLIHRTDAMSLARIEHDTLGRCCFPGVNVGNNSNISILLERILTRHSLNYLYYSSKNFYTR